MHPHYPAHYRSVNLHYWYPINPLLEQHNTRFTVPPKHNCSIVDAAAATDHAGLVMNLNLGNAKEYGRGNGMDKYRHIKKIGEGAFGKALLVEAKAEKTKFVVKEVSLSKMRPKEKEEARKECKVLSEMRHPNIISFVESFESGMKLYIVMDYADGGDLAGKLAARRGRLLPETQAVDWFVQICLAMKHVHDRKILHRDLKTQNIFLTARNMIKLGDFGIAKRLRNTRELARTQIGTPYYFSPEICDGKPYNNKSDVWSLGVVLYELLTLKYPFDGRSMQQLVLKICRGNYKPVGSTYSTEIRSLVTSMLQASQTKRPSVNGILKKPFIQKRISQFLDETLMNEEFSHTVIHGPPKRKPSAIGLKPGASKVPSKKPSSVAAARKPSAARLARPSNVPERRGSAAAKANAKAKAPLPPAVCPAVGAPPNRAPSSDRDTPKAQSRGKCGVCSENVMTDQDRTQDEKGIYFHIACLRKEREAQRQKELQDQRESEAERREAARRESLAEEAKAKEQRLLVARDAAKEEQDRYQLMLKERHSEFLQRRREGMANKKRLQAQLRGDAPAAAGGGQMQWHDMADNRAAAPKPAAPVHHLPRKASPVPAMSAAEKLAPEEVARKAAVDEYNERQRKARANRLAAENELATPVAEAAPEPQLVAPKAEEKAGRKAWGKPVAPSIDPALAETHVVKLADGEATHVVKQKPEQVDKVAESRAKLRDMIRQNRNDAKNRGGPPDDAIPTRSESPIPADTAIVVKKVDTPQDKAKVAGMLAALPILGNSLEATIGVVLDGQAEDVDESDSEEDADSGADGSVPIGDDDADMQEDKDYEAMLMHMSLSCSRGAVNGAKVLASMAKAAKEAKAKGNATPIEEEDEGAVSDTDSEFGEGDEVDPSKPESVFARMERVRSELEADLGFDTFFDAYKVLRDVFSVDEPPTTVPADVEKAVLAKLGDEFGDSYGRMVEMVKAENGIFE